ncbi:type II toxin-antitoxin system VapC family toxin [Pseudonocardia nigra]|uniref:type II toxin-antitoxin system VapC family toxin n=1 Tax=Pseudonocardia nigra TaxID=1921578 RepID=UPI001C6028EB|nr:type II toxin-antitoxin system VapC family toxin [Pseudonocardia nigra]
MTGLVVDTSAVLAILQREPGDEYLISALDAATTRLISAATSVELGIVVEARLGAAGTEVVTSFLRDASVEIVPVDGDAADRALTAWRRFGKGRHPAALNFGDCFSYALADRTGLPLLCTGNDFAATDLDVVRP